MSLFKVVMHYFNGEIEELDKTFDSEEEADAYGLYMCYYRFEESENIDACPQKTATDADYEIVEIDV